MVLLAVPLRALSALPDSLSNEQIARADSIIQAVFSQIQPGPFSITINPAKSVGSRKQSDVYHYDIIVPVGDADAIRIDRGRMIRGDDIHRLEYVVTYRAAGSQNGGHPDTADFREDEVVFKAELGTVVGEYTSPRQTYGSRVPADDIDRYFFLDEKKTLERIARGERVKVFTLRFKPVMGPGVYRLMFTAWTNRMLGITDAEWTRDDTIHINTARLTAGQVMEVQQRLQSYGGGNKEAVRFDSLLLTLLTPGAYKLVPENMGQGSVEIQTPSK
jgi:hypothetical protein